MKQLVKRLKQLDKRYLIVGLFILVGLVSLVFARAATPTAHFEAENTTRAANATTASDAAASGGQYLKFNQVSSGANNCPPYPQFPDVNCTGPTSVSLPLYSGSTDFNTTGQVVQNVEIRTSGGIYVGAKNVTFRNVKIIYTGPPAGPAVVALADDANPLFEDCEIDGQDKMQRAIWGSSAVTVRNCEIHHTANAIEVDPPVIATDNYIHDIWSPPNGLDWHADGIQVWKGSDGMRIIHNTIILTGNETSAVALLGEAGNLATDNIVEHNLLAGGGYTCGCGPGDSTYKVINNHFSTMIFPKVGAYNIWYYNTAETGGMVRSGNVIHETGAPANDDI